MHQIAGHAPAIFLCVRQGRAMRRSWQLRKANKMGKNEAIVSL